MSQKTNEERAQQAENALKVHQMDMTLLLTTEKQRRWVLSDEHVIDLLSNLRHLCDVKSLCFGDLDRIAYQHYLEEKGEERRG